MLLYVKGCRKVTKRNEKLFLQAFSKFQNFAKTNIQTLKPISFQNQNHPNL